MSQAAVKKSSSKSSTTVTKEDQDKINRFARLNSKHVDVCGDIADKDRELENYAEAMTSVEELELTSEEGDLVPYRVGDVFFNFSFSDASARLESEKTDLEKNRSERQQEKGTLETEMNQLKAELYSKFGDQINLDPDTE